MFSDFFDEYKRAGAALPEDFLGEKKAKALFTHLSELSEKGRLFNLTAITDEREALNKHIIDSLHAAAAVKKLSGGRAATLLDIGSGGGFPALPVAVACENVAVTALDSTAKKCDFIAATATMCGVSVDTIPERAEEAVLTRRETFDFVSARAVARLNILAELAAPFVKVGGCFLAMKGSAAEEEAAEAARAEKTLSLELVDRIRYEIEDGGERCILVYRKTAPTPKEYPRRYSQIKKKPL